MKEQITAWLQSGGTYAAGLELFDALARPVDKDRCQTYLHGGTDGVRRAMLEGELHRILHGLRNEPQLYDAETSTTASTQHSTPEIGIHIAKYTDLPADMQAKYDRLKQIAPLIGSLHADLTRTDIDGDKRKLTAQELCQLDDERRKLWQQLDAWAEGQTKEAAPTTQQSTPSTQQPTSTTEVSAEDELQLWRRDKRLRDNVRAARQTIEAQEGKEGCEGTVARAKERLARYTKEQVEVRARLAEIKQRRKKQ